jgi:hypothetical protein
MKKIQILGLALFAVLAFGAFAASAAFAVETPQYLVNGAVIALGTKVNSDIISAAAQGGGGPVSIEDMNASTKPDILCEVENSLMWLESNGASEIVSGECKNPVVDSGTCGKPVVVPVNLPWTGTLLEPTAGNYELDITQGKGLNAETEAPGWLAECEVLFVKIDDTCTTTKGKVLLSNLADGLLQGEFMEVILAEEQANCTVGGKEQGLVVGTGVIHALNASAELQTLAVSLTEEP